MEELKVSPHNRVLLVDLGYLLFYRYHATMKNLQFQEKTETLTDEEMLGYFKDHLEKQLTKLHKKFKVNADSVIFCKDAKQQTVWRMDVYPEYKGTRGVATEMVHKLKTTMYDTIASFGKVIGVDRLEADDVVYLSTCEILKNKPATEIFVLANDRDYLQMMHSANLHLVDAGGKEVKGVGDHATDVWIKVLMGDKSDNIPPVCKGVGKKTAEKLAMDATLRGEFIEKKQCHDNVRRNETLIRFENIPEVYQQAFHAKYAFV